jgi:hypothetical protein
MPEFTGFADFMEFLRRNKLAVTIGGLLAVGGLAHVSYFLYDMMQSSFGRGLPGGKYELQLPPIPAVKIQEAPQCQQKQLRWIGCSG